MHKKLTLRFTKWLPSSSVRYQLCTIATTYHKFIYAGLTFSIWIFTVVVLIIPTIEEAMVLAHFFKRLSFTENYNLSCPDNGDTCYNFQVQPALKDVDCKYHYISMYCEGKGEIRYVSEYHYW